MVRIPKIAIIELDASAQSVRVNGKTLAVGPSLKVCNHSPSGFSWGYNGSGPSQTALAILLKYLPKPDAQKHYQAFKAEFVSRWPFGENGTHEVPLAEWIKKRKEIKP